MIVKNNFKDWLIPILSGIIIGGVYVLFRWWPENAPNSYNSAVRRALPFNVSIISYQSKDAAAVEQLTKDPVFSKFFTPTHQTQTTLGSGILLTKDGWVVTNAHVIQNTERIVIQTFDNQLTTVTQVIMDPETDIAVLKTGLNSSKLLPITQSGQEQVGDVVFSLGNPFGIGQSASMGIISAQRRQQPGLTAPNDFIQTDAAINPGNSGGALINSSGEIIGMNTAIFSSSGGSQGIGFAIPFDVVTNIATQLIEHGGIQRGYLGIDVEPISISGIPSAPATNKGLKVISVQTNSPAAKAGIKSDDIIVELAHTEVSNRADAARLISRLMPGKALDILLIRDGQSLRLNAILTQKPEQ